ncbi:flagellar protein FlaG [Geomesophilobacter sediminis]|uniref:Flagellar protein FlaG n=1 Tax=Geomesophilobacter sediminis TaxID=2798584 RepID=A0A8J7IXW1_9BACT|nr:flagellar protein FlaG [Geomesophilobacter sediminis]MBJ6724847.1 flagellar protein FlaG [Geomesophilobacter sediminis]
MALEAISGSPAAYVPAPGTQHNSATAPTPTATDAGIKKQAQESIKLQLATKVQDATQVKKAATVEDRVKEATQALNDFMKHYGIKLQFDIDDKQTIVKVLNQQTGDVIRQIPSEEAIRISKALDTLQGLIIQKKV